VSKYNTPDNFVPGFAKQRSVVGNFVSDGTANPLSDSQLMSSSKDSSYDYTKYSSGTETRKQPNPGVQNRGNVQNGD
jgi:hypothetical protein